MSSIERDEDLDAMSAYMRELLQENPPAWWAPYWPFLHIRELRLLVVTFYKGSIVAKPVTKKHLFDWLLAAHQKPWRPKLVGFQVWY